MELELIPAKTGYGTKKMYTNCKLKSSVGSWPPKRKDMQLLIDKEFYVLPLRRSAVNWQSNFTICVYILFVGVSITMIVYKGGDGWTLKNNSVPHGTWCGCGHWTIVTTFVLKNHWVSTVCISDGQLLACGLPEHVSIYLNFCLFMVNSLS